jgi:glyceraldehyde 3-phosphate dehydrogenase
MTAETLTGQSDLTLGINGLGRIGKLTLWHHVSRKFFREIVVNIGREVGSCLGDLAQYLERDSTYGALHGFLHGHRSGSVVSDLNEAEKSLRLDGVKVRFLTKARNPKDIDWAGHEVRVVVDATGQFLDPTAPPDEPGGSSLGHLEAGAEKVLVSAPFKIKDKGAAMPDHAVTTVMGINDRDYDPRRHKIISHASCTTTCLAHMMKPLLDHFGAKRIMTASMSTIHAATGTQAVLDRLPKAGATDLRKTRSIMDNIILTSTGAAKALALVIPEMKQIGFMAESVRIPTATGSLIILVVNLQDDIKGEPIRRDLINGLYAKTAAADQEGYLLYTEEQNVSSDIVGLPRAAAIIEGHETHTRTGEITINLASVCGGQPQIIEGAGDTVLNISVTQAVIYGWYDNEFGGYVNLLGDRTVTVAQTL